MNLKKLTGAALLSLVVATGCGDDDMAGLNTDCSNIMGTFRASSFTANSVSGGRTADLLANGAAFELTIADNLYSTTYRSSATAEPLRSSGTASYSQGGLTFPTVMVQGGPGNQQFSCDLDDGTVTLRANNSTYRFAGQPQAEPANLSITLRRIGD